MKLSKRHVAHTKYAPAQAQCFLASGPLKTYLPCLLTVTMRGVQLAERNTWGLFRVWNGREKHARIRTILEKENEELRARIDWGAERATEAAKRAALVKQRRQTKRMNLKLDAETKDKAARRRQTEVRDMCDAVVLLACLLRTTIKAAI